MKCGFGDCADGFGIDRRLAASNRSVLQNFFTVAFHPTGFQEAEPPNCWPGFMKPNRDSTVNRVNAERKTRLVVRTQEENGISSRIGTLFAAQSTRRHLETLARRLVLHGSGERGDDLELVKKHGRLNKSLRARPAVHHCFRRMSAWRTLGFRCSCGDWR
jgi:hypothetical protein